jgi:hypothetical protein
MHFDRRLHIVRCDLASILKKSMEQQTTPVKLRGRPFEIDFNRRYASNLLIRISGAVTNRYDQNQELGVLLGDLGKNLDEVKRPDLPGILLRIRQAVEPCLELIQQKRDRLVLQ